MVFIVLQNVVEIDAVAITGLHENTSYDVEIFKIGLRAMASSQEQNKKKIT